jgi:hypothetical protein
MDEHPADETRLDAARRIYHALCVQYRIDSSYWSIRTAVCSPVATGGTHHWYIPARIETASRRASSHSWRQVRAIITDA